jgi:hypothetical protein
VALSQEQYWGLAFLTQQHNDALEVRNEMIRQRNEFAIESPLPLLEKITVEQFIESKTVELANQGYQQLIATKERKALELFRAAAPEVQQALLEQLEVPDILES